MYLERIIDNKINEVIEAKSSLSLREIMKVVDEIEIKHRNFKGVLSKKNISIIGEIKKASPSKGVILEDFDAVEIGKIYEHIEIDAISILTEKNFFKGDESYIKQVKDVTTKPILRKDFIVDEYQIYESKIIGADAILLIGAVLKNNLKDFYLKTKENGLQCIVEVHNLEELNNALEIDVDIIGINNRNLIDFSTSLKNTEILMRYVPKDKIVISESGIKTSEEIRYLRELGVSGVLIGETFMRGIDDVNKLERFIYDSKGGV